MMVVRVPGLSICVEEGLLNVSAMDFGRAPAFRLEPVGKVIFFWNAEYLLHPIRIDRIQPFPNMLQPAKLTDSGQPTSTASGPMVVTVHLGVACAVLLLCSALHLLLCRVGSRHSEREEPLACRTCGYNSRGNVSAICPECGCLWK